VERLAVEVHGMALAISHSHPTKPRVHFDWAIGLAHTKPINQPPSHMDVKLTNEQQVRVTLSPKTDTGKPAKLDGSPSWTVTEGNSQVVVDDDGLGALLVSSDEPGDTLVTIKADADLGEGIEELVDVLKLTVVGATAKNLGITVGTPEAKP